MVSTAKALVQAAGRTVKLRARGTGVEASPTQIALKPPGNQTLFWEHRKLKTGFLYSERFSEAPHICETPVY